MIAKDVMQTRFTTLSPDDTIAAAVKCFQTASASENKKIFGLMVTDRHDHLVGMLSMYDILLFIQPKHIHIWGEMEDLDPSVLYDERLEQVKSILVGDIMHKSMRTGALIPINGRGAASRGTPGSPTFSKYVNSSRNSPHMMSRSPSRSQSAIHGHGAP